MLVVGTFAGVYGTVVLIIGILALIGGAYEMHKK